MAISTLAQGRIKAMLADGPGKVYAEVLAKLAAPAVLSKAAKNVILIALTDAKAATELEARIAVHGTMSKRTQKYFTVALGSDKVAAELIALLSV